MPFIANTDADRALMLKRIGLKSLDALFDDYPESKRFPKLSMEDGISEIEVMEELAHMANKNESSQNHAWFMGAGCYNHFIPSVVPYLSSRGEFVTAYTPYQPEVSQGTLQAIFEYQSMIATLTGTDAVNASHYDGATALAEAVLMAYHNNDKRTQIYIPTNLHPEYKEVLKTYFEAFSVKFVEYSDNVKAEAQAMSEDASCFVVMNPSFTGEVTDLTGLSDLIHAKGALFIVHTDPILLGLYKSPGSYGADIVTAEGQCLGNAMNYGGPFLGVMGCTGKLVRKMPGRIVGEAKDVDGKRGFVLTLVAREQHIRREKAVSNICSNQGLSTLQAAIYLEAMGKNGLKQAAELCYHKAHYAAKEIAKIPGCSIETASFFKEFLVKLPCNAEDLSEALFVKNIVPGLPMNRYYPERKNELLICVTEMNSKAQIDTLVAAMYLFVKGSAK